MNLFDIEERLRAIIEYAVEPETGEMLEGYDLEKALSDCSMELDKKIENISLFIKQLKVEEEALKKEKTNLQKRQNSKHNLAERLEKYLDNYFRHVQSDYFEDETGKVKFHKFETPKCVVSYRKSDTVEIKDLNKVPENYIKPRQIKDTDVMKTEIKKYLKEHENETIDGVELVKNKNISIK